MQSHAGHVTCDFSVAASTAAVAVDSAAVLPWEATFEILVGSVIATRQSLQQLNCRAASRKRIFIKQVQRKPLRIFIKQVQIQYEHTLGISSRRFNLIFIKQVQIQYEHTLATAAVVKGTSFTACALATALEADFTTVFVSSVFDRPFMKTVTMVSRVTC